MKNVKHATVSVSQEIQASPQAVFDAYADVDARADWTAPPGDQVRYETSDFRVGGTDTYKCGPDGDLRFDGVVAYLDIAPEARIVFTETISIGNDAISISQVTWEFDPDDSTSTQLTVTAQICSLVGDDMVDGTREGLAHALTNLSERFSGPAVGQQRAGGNDA